MEKAQLKLKLYHDQHSRSRSFYNDEPVWVQKDSGKGFVSGIVKRRVGELSYIVYVEGKEV